MNRYLVLVPRLVLVAVVTVVDVLALFAWFVGFPLGFIPLWFALQAGLVGLICSQGTRCNARPEDGTAGIGAGDFRPDSGWSPHCPITRQSPCNLPPNK
jgi:hypothetical protein